MEAGGGDDGLAIGQPAVVGGDVAVEQDAKTGLAEAGDGQFEQQPVLPDAAGEGCCGWFREWDADGRRWT
jgi:hypothetical protein